MKPGTTGRRACGQERPQRTPGASSGLRRGSARRRRAVRRCATMLAGIDVAAPGVLISDSTAARRAADMRSPRETQNDRWRVARMCPSTAIAPHSSRYSRAAASIDAVQRAPGRHPAAGDLAAISRCLRRSDGSGDARGFGSLRRRGGPRTLEELIGDARPGADVRRRPAGPGCLAMSPAAR